MLPVVLGLALMAAAEPTSVAVFPLAQDGLSEADADDLMRRITADLAARPGVTVPGGFQTTLDLAASLGDELDGCRIDAACLGGLADATGVSHLVTLSVTGKGPLWEVNASLRAAGDGATEASFTRALDGELFARTEQTRLTVAALTTRFSPAGDGKLVINLDEDGAALTIDGLSVAFTPGVTTALKAGAHVVELTKDGFEPYRQALEVPSTGQVVLDAKLTPTVAFVDDYTFWAWTLTSTSIALLAAGVVGVVLAAALGGGSAGLAWFTNEQVKAHNADPNRTAEQQAMLNLQTNLAYGGYVAAGVLGALSLVPLVSGPVVFIFADNPFRYAE